MALSGSTGNQFVPRWKITRQPVPIKVDEAFTGKVGERRKFSKQYCNTYTARLNELRPRLEAMATGSWPDVEIKKIRDLCEFAQASSYTKKHRTVAPPEVNTMARDHAQKISFRQGVTVAIIGTCFKLQSEKPSILQEFRKDVMDMVPLEEPKNNYTSLSDSLKLEDESGSVELFSSQCFQLQIDRLVTGAIISVKGRPNINGRFEVSDIIFPTPPPRSPITPKMDIELVFVSGMEIGSGYTSSLIADLFFDYLGGLVGEQREVAEVANKSVLFILGNTFGASEEKGQEKLTELSRTIDIKLENLTKIIDVCILPGDSDPSSPMIPQAAIHRLVLPKASSCPRFKSLTNPVRIELPTTSTNLFNETLDIVLTAGQNVTDVLKNVSPSMSALEVSADLLRCSNLFPTAPDSLPLRPDIKGSEFILQTLPHLFVIGNQQTFSTTKWNGTQICTIPKFCETGTIAILNSAMEFVEMSFKLGV